MNRNTLTQILDLARWAPSGDNTQPWRFEIVTDSMIRVHGFDTRDHVLYDFDGHPSHIAHGALLETVRLAATRFGLTSSWSIMTPETAFNPIYEIAFARSEDVQPEPLAAFIESRTVQRRPMKTTALSATQRNSLVAAAGEGYKIQFFESPAARWHVARLLWDSAKIRLTCREAYPVHKSIIEWRARFSKDRIPEKAVGVDPATARLMQWVLGSWKRVEFFNRYLFGTIAPRLQLDLIPGYFCAAHLLVRPTVAPRNLEDWIRLGVAWQRVWLTATQQGLHFQPQMTPVIFRWYTRAGREFSEDPELTNLAHQLSDNFDRMISAQPTDPIGFFARVGTSQVPRSRSLRLDLDDLMTAPR